MALETRDSKFHSLIIEGLAPILVFEPYLHHPIWWHIFPYVKQKLNSAIVLSYQSIHDPIMSPFFFLLYQDATTS